MWDLAHGVEAHRERVDKNPSDIASGPSRVACPLSARCEDEHVLDDMNGAVCMMDMMRLVTFVLGMRAQARTTLLEAVCRSPIHGDWVDRSL